ncbi:bifunctional diguanylate cyclase/phosphodiesterase [Phaeobacter sp. QD34_3]|uniref:putative bifunctional diguanylate cyclase/phosphodiesterase n=1 Tax=unclassified Phaeobacter TaxID=2621772 RepID=UPI00237F663D|nr:MULTISPECIES: bifunctional diguanylate cyclase/phosphodiesterase [unclassified Phaeobacter]MDE4132788.1 bifunctional diguanylate cyclase/phosphodiesterase [Phaeobacter sp. QD34_3]MDE4136419.1 bifunctional diguanylate cyclase/phosphodiesterase [Phaeobacter sp. QD34_24]
MLFRFLGFLAIALSVLAAGIVYATRSSVFEAMRRESVDKAVHHATYMASQIRDLEGLLNSATPAPDQLNQIRDLRHLGDVFRFKLFDAAGRLVLVSDDPSLKGGLPQTLGEPDPEAVKVIASHVSFAEVKDGTEKPNRPDLYAEAYVPLLDAEGEIFGVAEVYIDQTDTHGYFHESFSRFAVLLTTVCALLFSVPYIGYMLQRRRAEHSQEEVEFLASYDSLTGLMNRREFLQQADALRAEGELSAICYMDADKFKAINDVHGHAVGDAYLVHLAGILRSCTHHNDLLARFGGDEFVIGFRNLDHDGVVARVRSIIVNASEEFHHDDAVIAGSMSAGIALLGKDTCLDTTLSYADAALYHSKSNGRNTFSVYGEEMGDEYRKRMALHARLRQSTKEKNFAIVYQRLVDAQSKQVVGYEALLRMKDEDGSEIEPSIFIPVAEELGLIADIGAWVIRKATREIAQLDDHSTVAINLSAAQLCDGSLPDIVRSALAEAELPAHRLELEITESLLLDDDPAVAYQIDCLKEMGVSLAMDDFGTGYSSLSYLWRFGFDRLKVDRSFVTALDRDPERSRQIIEAILLLGDRLDMRVTAEGIETREQSEYLSQLGCDILQGYLYGRPTSLDGIETPEDSEDPGTISRAS